MAKLVTPKVFLVGFTQAHAPGMLNYLKYTGQEEFLDDWNRALMAGISTGEALCSLYAKLCYKSLGLGKNDNVGKVRDIGANIAATHDSGHGSVFEHCNLNFIVTDCSRVYTHEQVRHRQGWAYSQTSGRFCRGDSIDVILDPITGPINKEMEIFVTALEREYAAWCNRMGLNGLRGLYDAMSKETTPGKWSRPSLEVLIQEAIRLGMKEKKIKPGEYVTDENSFLGVAEWEHTFDRKKKITSALRRVLPNGQSNEIGMTVNVRALRHTVQLRTGAGAEWEIRHIYAQIYDLVRDRFPTIFHGAKTRTVDGLPEVYGMKLQPYDIEAGDPAALHFYETSALETELAKRHSAV